MTDPDAKVREAALLACAYSFWDGYQEPSPPAALRTLTGNVLEPGRLAPPSRSGPNPARMASAVDPGIMFVGGRQAGHDGWVQAAVTAAAVHSQNRQSTHLRVFMPRRSRSIAAPRLALSGTGQQAADVVALEDEE
jgi:hypothetical protein